MSKRTNSCSNSFAALSLHEEQEPKKVLQMQSSRQQKKLEYQAKKALSSAGTSSSKPQQQSQLQPLLLQQQQQQQQQQQRSRQAAGNSSSNPLSPQHSGTCSPGLQDALEAIALAESKLSGQQQPQPQQEPSFAAAAAQRCGSRAASSTVSLSASPSASSDCSAWGNWPALQDSSGDPWSCSTALQQQTHELQQQQQQQQQWPGYQQVKLSPSPGNSFRGHHHHQQQQQQDEEPWPVISDCGSSGGSWGPGMSQAQAYCWRSFAMRFAEAAWAAGNDEAADGALQFGASESLTAAVFAAGDAAAAAEIEEVAAEAAAVGLTVEELLQAQQEELLVQINNSKRKGTVWRSVKVDWGVSSSRAGASSNGSSCASPAIQQHLVQPTDVEDGSAFPQLESSPPSSSWQQVKRSPHAVGPGWRGGRLAPKSKGIKLLHTPNSTSGSAQKPKPSTVDFHWDLRMEGFAPMQREGEESSSICSIDPWGGVPAPSAALHCGASAAARTREILAGQEAAAADGARVRGISSRNRCEQETVRSMMEKASSKGAHLAAAGAPAGSSGHAAAAADAAAGESDEEDEGPCGSKAAFSYDWGSLFKYAAAAGWLPVNKAEGGGGSHFKLRRVLPISGRTQTVMLPCTPSDSQRGVRNAAASLKKKDDEMRQLEAEAKAGKQPSSTAVKGKGKRK